MSNKSVRTEVFVIENCILSHPHVFTAEPFKRNGMPQGEPFYSAVLLFGEEVKTVIQRYLQDLAPRAYPNGEYRHQSFGWPINMAKDHKSYMNNPRVAGMYYVNTKASLNYKPQVVGISRQPVIDRGEIYAGCIVAAGISLYSRPQPARPGEVGVGIGVGLSALMKTADGESLAGDSVDTDSLFQGVQTQVPQAGWMSPNGAPAPQNDGVPWKEDTGQPTFGMPTPPFLS